MRQLNTSSSNKADPAVVLRSTMYMVSIIGSTMLVGPIMLLLAPLPIRFRYAAAQHWVRYNLWALRAFCGLSFVVEGRENIPEQNGVILCKHQSAWETIALQTIFPSPAFILKSSLLEEGVELKK